MLRLILFLSFIALLSGCATMQDLYSSLNEEEQPTMIETQPGTPAPRYSETPQVGIPTDRQYRRMTKNRMEEESELGSQAGSMWVMEGQGAYLFAQNKSRREGDILKVNMDGAAMKQVETKVGVIKQLIKELEAQLAAENAARAPAAAPAEGAAAGEQAKAPEPPKVEKEEPTNLDEVKVVPARIVERLPDGNYRVKGAQPFMIGKKEYKVIVTGIIRPEDYNDEGVSSQKLLDPQYDVVSIRRNSANEQNVNRL